MEAEKLQAFVIEKLSKELSSSLTYHNLAHTLSVMKVCKEHIMDSNIGEKDATLLLTAAALHDIGFLWVYRKHEERGVEFAENELPKWGFSKAEIETICNLILATKVPQSPKTILEKILCDADLNYLGTDSFIEIGKSLYQEFLTYGIVQNEEEWNQLQISFLKGHKFRTEKAIKLRDPIKQVHLAKLIQEQNSK